MRDDLATFPVSGNAAVRAVRVPCMPENVAFVAARGVDSLAPALGLPILLPPVRAPLFDDPKGDPETADLADAEEVA